MENKILNKPFDGKINNAWDNSLPIGNGRLGATVSGAIGIHYESITLNEDSIWYGGHRERGNPDAKKNVEKIRNLLREGKFEEADRLCYMALTSMPKYFGAYEPMAEVNFRESFHFGKGLKYSNYKRELDMENGIATVSANFGDYKIKKEYFVSHPDNAFVFRFTCDKPIFNFQMHIMRRPCDMGCTIAEDKIVALHGQSGPDGVKFDLMYSAKCDGTMERIGDFFSFRDASEVIIYVTARTSFYEEDPYKVALDDIHKVLGMDYETILERHKKDFSSLYNRAGVDFGSNTELPLEERLEKVKNGESDKGLLELFVNYGRYLMISASRHDSQAMNLQGIWNNAYAAPWECNYTLNINTQMNYWIAESTGLSDCHEPLFRLIERMIPNGEKTAKEIYGCDGFVCHHTSNIWGDTAIEGTSFPSSVWPMGGAWLILHMWDHYLFTGDTDFLSNRAFPVMKKAALFYTQYMTLDEDGYYITGPSLSPENVFISDDGQYGRECMGPEIDCQIVRALFRSLIRAYEVLGLEDEEYEKYKKFMANIRPSRINSQGGIMEWDKDYKEFYPSHRHLSPMFGLYPDYQINLEDTPHLARACEKSIKLRHDAPSIHEGFVGWVGGWAAACFARLREGEKARDTLYEFLGSGAFSMSFLNNWPCFQIDGNFGAAAAVCEMLLTSDEKSVRILPGICDELSEGSFYGLRARGGFEFTVSWKDKKPFKATVKSLCGNKIKLYADGISGVNTSFVKEDEYIVFETKKGESYELEFNR